MIGILFSRACRSDREMSDSMDDGLELEVSRLGDHSSTKATEAQAEPAAPSLSESEPQAGAVSLRHGSTALRARGFIRAGAVGLIVALTVAVILVSFPGIGQRLGGPLTPFAPTPTVPPGSDIILLAHTVPWGE